MLKSSCSIEAALTFDWNYNSFFQKLYAQNIVSQITMLINIIKEIAYRSTEKKTLACNAIIKLKLGNLVRISIYENFLSSTRTLYLNKILFKKLFNVAAGGKIKTKVKLLFQSNLNSCVYRSEKNLLAFELSRKYLITKRFFTIRKNSKSDYIDKNLTDDIKLQLNSKKWITIKQKKLLIQHIEKCQTNLFVLITKNKSSMSETFYIVEVLLNSLLFQVYTVEIFLANKSSKSVSINGMISNNKIQKKLVCLKKLSKFRKRKFLPLKIIYIFKKSDEKRFISIPSIVDYLIQKLFILVLNPIIEVNSDFHSYGFRKGRSPIMAIGDIQKNLQNKIRKRSILELTFVWNANIKKYSDFINQEWLIKNVPFPIKYKYILKNWLNFYSIKIETIKGLGNGTRILQGYNISPLLINFALNGIETLINEEIINYQKTVSKSYLKIYPNGNVGLYLFLKLSDGSFKKRKISCQFFRYSDTFIVICSSNKLLFLIKKRINVFLNLRGLKIQSNKSQTILFKINASFDFLGYTFMYLACQVKKCKVLQRHNYEYKHRRPRLFVSPSKIAIQFFKLSFKAIITNNQSVSAYKLIAFLNPIIRGWVNYYLFSNVYNVFWLLDNWIYIRVIIWMKRKHPKSSKIWLHKYYLLLENFLEEHDLKQKSKITNNIAKKIYIHQVKQNKLNFYGIIWEKYFYEVLKINVLLWPTSIKKL